MLQIWEADSTRIGEATERLERLNNIEIGNGAESDYLIAYEAENDHAKQVAESIADRMRVDHDVGVAVDGVEDVDGVEIFHNLDTIDFGHIVLFSAIIAISIFALTYL